VSATTWALLVREHGWRRPRVRVHPAKPTVGLRASRPNEYWHIDVTVLKLLDGTKTFLHAVIRMPQWIERMLRRIILPAVLLAPALACGGRAQAVPGDGGGDGSTSSSGGGSSGGNASPGGSSGASDVSGGGSGSSSGGGASSGSDAGADAAFDADVPDAFPANCGQYTLVIRPDAAPNACAFTPADVACNTSTDCTSYLVNGCGCIEPLYGVNTASTVKCEPPPCPREDCQADASGFETQDCKLVQGSNQAAVACVNHQCMTYAVGL
jgi:hypothetical protein